MPPDSYISDLIGYQPDAARYDVVQLDPSETPMLIANMIEAGSRVLDVGCGTGCVTDLIRRNCAAEVIGVEPDSTRAAVASQRGLSVEVDFLNEQLLERLGTFDVVVFADVLEHCSHPGHLLRIAKKFLRPNGRCIISVPNIAHWTVRRSLFFGKFNYEATGILDATHIRWFTNDSLLAFIERIGLDVEEISYSSGTALSAYTQQSIFRFVPIRIRNHVIGRLTAWFPRLFACQFIVRTRVGEAASKSVHPVK
jgi:methionine biosynthesis protein MetW